MLDHVGYQKQPNDELLEQGGEVNLVKVLMIIRMSEVGTDRYVNLPIAYSGDDRFNVSRHGWSKAIY